MRLEVRLDQSDTEFVVFEVKHYIIIYFFLLQRSRKRRSSSRSDDEYDGDYPEQDYKMEQEEDEESKTIMLRGLPVHVTEDDVSSQFAIQWHSCFLKEKPHQTVYHITFS